MIKILFVCHGNICRSPMAEFLFRDLLHKQGLEGRALVASAATSAEEIGNPVYPPARRKLAQLGIDAGGKRAVQLVRADYGRWDRLIGMEQYNIRNMLRILGGDPEGKVFRLLDFTARPRDIEDPWYSGDFDTACTEIREGCAALLDRLRAEGQL
ncbi:low molecular weight phosphotyrosine protein phosphatase [Anaerofilum sp. BX8]|uniref:protein-tyrosine-phosphatase n=1 Tax=Anaerofilum hominis TaxID=2763016 RepID=A0A923IAA0_9FIRM|nr:low molecular weight protein-tyrosine-phosphatase [Anaerofilum hominis]MBC5581787.1 low molecular weight phosphotyrosine protein phosphatase [Anaerofilum hominis]